MIVWNQVAMDDSLLITLRWTVTLSGGKAILLQAWGSHISRQSAHAGGKVVSPTHRPPLPTRKYSWYSFLSEADSTPAAGRIMSMKNSSDTIGNRTRDLPTCSAVPQPKCDTAYPLTLSGVHITCMTFRNQFHFIICCKSCSARKIPRANK
jgi:hypothetical protein